LRRSLPQSIVRTLLLLLLLLLLLAARSFCCCSPSGILFLVFFLRHGVAMAVLVSGIFPQFDMLCYSH
jgi:hypothetical protein